MPRSDEEMYGRQIAQDALDKANGVGVPEPSAALAMARAQGGQAAPADGPPSSVDADGNIVDAVPHPQDWMANNRSDANIPFRGFPGAATAPLKLRGGYVPQGHQVAVHHPMLTPGELELPQMYNSFAVSDENKAIQASREAAVQKATADVSYYEAAQNEMKAAQARIDKLEADKMAYVERQRSELDEMSRQRAATSVNPEQFWDNHGGGFGRVMAAIAVGLGQFGASLNGGQNSALNIINDNINRNIRAQEFNLQSKDAAIRNKSNLLADNLALYKDREQALTATKINYLDLAMQQLKKSYAETAKGPGVEANFNSMMGELERQRQKDAEHFGALKHADVTEQSSEAFKVVPVGGVAGGAPQFQLSPKELKGLEYLPTLGGFVAPGISDAGKEKIRDNANQIAMLQEHIRNAAEKQRELLGINAVTSPQLYNKKMQEIDAAYHLAAERASLFLGQGVIREFEEKMAQAKVGGGNYLIGPNSKIMTDLDSVKNRFDGWADQSRVLAGSNGILKGQVQWAQGPYGPYPVPVLTGGLAPNAHDSIGYAGAARKGNRPAPLRGQTSIAPDDFSRAPNMSEGPNMSTEPEKGK